MIIKIVVLSDLHVGSLYGLCPTHYFNEHTNAFQRWAIDRWRDFTLEYKYPDYLVLNGDIIDGPGKKDPTVLCITDSTNQVEAAADLILPLVGKNTIIYGVSGSGYHYGKGTGFDGDRQVTEKLIEQSKAKGKHYREEFGLDLSKYGMKSITFHHKAKNVNTEANITFKKAYKTLAPRVEMIVASHLHRKLLLTDGVAICHTPCWEWETDFMSYVDPVDIGSTIIYVDVDKKTIFTDFFSPQRPTELFVAMQNWVGLSYERENELREANEKQQQEEFDKLSKLFQNVPKNSLRKIVAEVKKQESVSHLSLPKAVDTRTKGVKEKEFKLPRNLPKAGLRK